MRTTILSLLLLVETLCLIKCGVEHADMHKKEVKSIEETTLMLNYYQDTEELLDELNIDVDNPVFETDKGAKYLESKYAIDSLWFNNY